MWLILAKQVNGIFIGTILYDIFQHQHYIQLIFSDVRFVIEFFLNCVGILKSLQFNYSRVMHKYYNIFKLYSCSIYRISCKTFLKIAEKSARQNACTCMCINLHKCTLKLKVIWKNGFTWSVINLFRLYMALSKLISVQESPRQLTR